MGKSRELSGAAARTGSYKGQMKKIIKKLKNIGICKKHIRINGDKERWKIIIGTPCIVEPYKSLVYSNCEKVYS